jgi:dTDP-4-dehydrorhamnose reductase
MLRLARDHPRVRVVDDQIWSPTWVAELARAIRHLVDTGQQGLFHVVNDGAVAWNELAMAIFRIAQIPCQVLPITSAEYGAQAHRPPYSALDITKYRATNGPPMSRWDDALAQFLSQRGGTLINAAARGGPAEAAE